VFESAGAGALDPGAGLGNRDFDAVVVRRGVVGQVVLNAGKTVEPDQGVENSRNVGIGSGRRSAGEQLREQ